MKSAALAKQKTVRKPRAKKATKNVSYCFTVDVAPPDQCFWVNEGPVVKDVAELRQALREMTEEQFRYHAMDRGVNDFAKWMDEVLGHCMCAAKVAKAKTRESAVRALATCSDK